MPGLLTVAIVSPNKHAVIQKNVPVNSGNLTARLLNGDAFIASSLLRVPKSFN